MLDKSTIKSLLEGIDARIRHIEDISADNREVIVKLVKQSNQIVQFLKDLEIEEITDEYSSTLPDLQENIQESRFTHIKELLDDFMERHQDLKEFEEELQNHKENITPGQMGEA